MRNIKLTIEYDGSQYNGWQRQTPRVLEGKPKRKKLKTIQEEIERALKKLLKEKVVLISAGRTDAGVHAEAQVANFKTDTTLLTKNIRDGLNSLLPKDIAIRKVEDVSLNFHSRFDAKGKLYRYRILNSKIRSPLFQRHAAFIPYFLDISKMRQEAKMLIGKHNFKAFQSSNSKTKDSTRYLKRLEILKKDKFIDFYIEADGFLYNMVRNIVGTLVEVGRGRFGAGSLKKIILNKSRPSAGPTLPAEGLCLMKVRY